MSYYIRETVKPKNDTKEAQCHHCHLEPSHRGLEEFSWPCKEVLIVT